MEQVLVDKRVLGSMLLGSLRYALGRRTYIVTETVSFWIRAYWPVLADPERTLLKRDLEDEISRHERIPTVKGLGDPCDERVWRGLLAFMKTEERK